MSRFAALLLPLLLLACRPPESSLKPPAPPPTLRPGPAQLELEVTSAPGVAEAEPLRQEALAQLKEQLVAWNPVEVPPGTARKATVPRLRVHVRHYQPRPAGSPFEAIAVPGIIGMGAGAIILHAGAGAQELGALPYAIFGGGFLGVGLAALIVGITLESRKAYLDRQRGYPLHAFRAQVQIVWPVGGGEKEEKENYRALNFGDQARPMAAADAADPAKVRREMMRALALTIREDFGRKTGWGRPEED